MKTIDAAAVDTADLNVLDKAVRAMAPDSELAFFLASIAADIRDGEDVTAGKDSDLVTPARAARLLGISRVHFYKVLNAGEVPFVTVGRDRRVALADIKTLLDQRNAASKETAERFAHRGAARDAALRSL